MTVTSAPLAVSPTASLAVADRHRRQEKAVGEAKRYHRDGKIFFVEPSRLAPTYASNSDLLTM
jgi:hypothetical protein